MNTIEQREENDCGVACVAMLTTGDYDDAFKVIHSNGRSKLTKTADLHAALIALGREPLTKTRQPFHGKSLRDLDTDALVFVEMENGKDSKHWVVWDAKAKKTRDPYHTKYKHKLRGYLAIK
ncbi:MAG: cysteine peptidase family C39 domain-containing protein [Usitatibacteraceae bacterium]